MQRRIYGHATDVEIRPLNEEKAVQAAVDLLGEIFVFSVGYLFILIFFFLVVNPNLILLWTEIFLFHITVAGTLCFLCNCSSCTGYCVVFHVVLGHILCMFLE